MPPTSTDQFFTVFIPSHNYYRPHLKDGGRCCFQFVCQFTPRQRGGGTPSQVWMGWYPIPDPDGGCTPSQVWTGGTHPADGGTPFLVWMGDTPSSWWGTPSQFWTGGNPGYPWQGLDVVHSPSARTGWGTPYLPGMGYPPPAPTRTGSKSFHYFHFCVIHPCLLTN